ncbi:MAG: hypothetical protein HYY25_00605 [Candidatus Wallbacteria bacterium]|nr:hypothetical protein [Candidatus Wallbacteria bacterium]
MEPNRWFVLSLLSISLVFVIIQLWLLGKRISRLKSIINRAPREEGLSLIGAAKTVAPPPTAKVEGVPVGSLFGEDANWVDEKGIDPQRTAAPQAPHVSVDAGKSMLDRFGAPAAAAASAPALPRTPPPPPPAGEGDLLKKLLNFDAPKGPQAEASPTHPEPPPPPGLPGLAIGGGRLAGAPPVPPRPGEAFKPGSLLATLGAAKPQAPTAPASASAEPTAQAAPDSGMLGRLGAFSTGDVGAPESAKPKPPPLVKAPSFSLSAPPSPAVAAPAAAGESPSPLKSLLAFGTPQDTGDAGSSLLARRPAAAEEAGEAAPKPAGSIMGRLGASEPPKAPAGSPLGSLMSRLGDQGVADKAPVVHGVPPPADVLSAGPSALLARFGKGPAAMPPPESPPPVAEAAEPAPAAAQTNPLQALARLARKPVETESARVAPALRLSLGKPAPKPEAPAVDVEALEAAFLEDQGNTALKRQLAEAYLSAGRFEFAAEAFSELADGPDRQDSDLFNLGLAQAREGNRDAAIRTFTAVSEQRKGTPWAGKAIAQLLKLKLAKPA